MLHATREPRFLKIVAGLGAACLPLKSALAESTWAPVPWGMSLQVPGSEIGGRIDQFHDLLLAVIIGVVLVVLALLVYVVVRFRRSRNPIPSQRTHNLPLEIIWTVVPCLIILGLAWVSFPLLYAMDRMPTPDLTLKVTGHQWYWSYDYPDRDNIAFDSMGLWDASDPSDADVAPAIKEASAHWLIQGEPMRLLEVDNRVVLPVGKVVRVQITGSDVLHSWFVSSLAVNRMAVVGRLNEVWLKIDKPGLYYGECSMICGTGHGFMPIVIEAVSPEQFDLWATKQKTAETNRAQRSRQG